MRSAALFQVQITPSRVLLIIASSEDCTMAAKGPPHHGFGDGVEIRDLGLDVGRDDRIANAGEGNFEPFPLLLQFLGLAFQGLLRSQQLALGALARGADAFGILQGRGAQQLLFPFIGFHQRMPNASAASAVPRTRARILANAFSRVVDVSSQNGENPQSSVVPSCSTGMYCAASRTRSRTSSGVSMRGSIGATTPTKIRWSAFMCSRMILRTRTRS